MRRLVPRSTLIVCAQVFTRNPALFLSSQHTALLCHTLVCAIEKMLPSGEIRPEISKEHVQMVLELVLSIRRVLQRAPPVAVSGRRNSEAERMKLEKGAEPTMWTEMLRKLAETNPVRLGLTPERFRVTLACAQGKYLTEAEGDEVASVVGGRESALSSVHASATVFDFRSSFLLLSVCCMKPNFSSAQSLQVASRPLRLSPRQSLECLFLLSQPLFVRRVLRC